MRRFLLLFTGYWFLVAGSFAQTVTQKMQKAFTAFEKDSQLKHAASSLYVIDANTGQVVFDKNSLVGLAPASTQKIVTSATAFELLGKDFRYKTIFGIGTRGCKTCLCIQPSGDPTLGSWRWDKTKEERVFNRIRSAINKQNIKVSGPVIIYAEGWNHEATPDGWIWQDIGNYYGAGADIMNWRENQYDLLLKSGDKTGDPVSVVGSIPANLELNFTSFVNSAAKGSGDNAYIYFDHLNNKKVIVRGTIPVKEDKFIISGAMISCETHFLDLLSDSLMLGSERSEYLSVMKLFEKPGKDFYKIHEEISPSLDSIIYWLNKKSINLYAEALLKTIAYEKKGFGSTDSGVVVVKDFWKQKRMDEDELNLVDGSGLSPLNRVTTHVQVQILKYAKSKNWFPYFDNSLPEYNGMKMKSGTIRGVKGFCGYHKAKNGKEYIFSFLVNNYSGSPSALVNKMYKVLDVLK